MVTTPTHPAYPAAKVVVQQDASGKCAGMKVPEKDKDGKQTMKLTPILPRTVKKTAGKN